VQGQARCAHSVAAKGGWPLVRQGGWPLAAGGWPLGTPLTDGEWPLVHPWPHLMLACGPLPGSSLPRVARYASLFFRPCLWHKPCLLSSCAHLQHLSAALGPFIQWGSPLCSLAIPVGFSLGPLIERVLPCLHFLRRHAPKLARLEGKTSPRTWLSSCARQEPTLCLCPSLLRPLLPPPLPPPQPLPPPRDLSLRVSSLGAFTFLFSLFPLNWILSTLSPPLNTSFPSHLLEGFPALPDMWAPAAAGGRKKVRSPCNASPAPCPVSRLRVSTTPRVSSQRLREQRGC